MMAGILGMLPQALMSTNISDSMEVAQVKSALLLKFPSKVT
jgi:hypothetical protein